MTRCPACGASNPPTASWCGQCYAVFDAEPGAAAAPAVARPADPAGPAVFADPDSPATEAGGFFVAGGEVRWRCAVCAVDNDVAARRCTGCGTALDDTPRAVAEPPASAGRALLAAALAPGGGHVLLGRTAEGLVRLGVALLWCLGAAALLSAGGPRRAAPAAVPLLLGTMVLWIGGIADVVALRAGARPVITGRVLLWLVVAVTGLAGFGLVAAVMAVRVGPGLPGS